MIVIAEQRIPTQGAGSERRPRGWLRALPGLLAAVVLAGAPVARTARASEPTAPQSAAPQSAAPQSAAPQSAAPQSAVPQSAAIAQPTPLSRFARLRKQLEGLLHSGLLSKLRVGLTVRDAGTGEEVISHNAGTPFNPASNTKIFTTAAALSTLGPDFRYQTALLTQRGADPGPEPPVETSTAAVPLLLAEKEVIAGDLFLQGSGDPSLGPTGLAQLAHELARRGVRRIQGDVLLDGQFRDLQALQKEATPATYGAGALILNRDAYTVRVEPGRAGQLASAWVDSRSPFFVVHNLVRTVRGKKGRILVDHALRGDRLAVTVRGRIGVGRGRVAVRQRFGFATTWAAAILRQALTDAGITVGGTVRVGPPPAGPLRVVATHLSEPLADICRVVNKDSNNYVADAVWKTLGAERFGLPGTLEKGARAVDEWLQPLGLSPSRVHLVNGSGLTYENRIRPEDLGQLLYKLYHSLDLGPVFMQTLAVGGIDGTIHSRFRGALSGLVRGKTGTLNGVSVLSGYVGAQPGVLIFTIFVEGFRPRRLPAIRQAQTDLVEEMVRCLREGGPGVPGAAPTAVPAAAPIDKSPDLGPDDQRATPEPEAEEVEAG